MSEDRWVQVVPPSARAEAPRLFERWLREAGLDAATIAADDVRIDLMCGRGYSAVRYLVRKRALPPRQL